MADNSEAPPAPDADTPEAVVAANVRHLREALGMSQTELARRATLGASDMAIWSIETRKRRIRVDELCALAAALETTPERLLAPGAELGAAARQYEVRIDGGITELVTADDAEADERGLLHFYLRGERVFFTSVARVLSVREAP
jgi:transcriptional regulator with XRE-family HTH domain